MKKDLSGQRMVNNNRHSNEYNLWEAEQRMVDR